MRIIYFDIDCLRPDHLGCYGYNRPTSPNIDAIAAESMRFNNYYCSSSPCLPSRTALVSGRFGIRNGVVSNHSSGARFRIRNKNYHGPMDENEMFPRLLRKHKIDTIAVSNFADRHNAHYFMNGWAEFYTPNLKGGLETAEEVNDVVLRWLEDNKARDNYYLHINYWDAHRPYKVDKLWADKMEDFPISKVWPDEKVIQEHQNITGPFTAQGQFRDNKSPFPLMPDSVNNRADFEHMIAGYDASIRYVDYELGRVIDFLKKEGLYEDTVIIISGDHGDAFGEHGIYSDHVCADECIHNIPLIVRWPGVAPENAENNSLLYNIDLAPTVCDILDIPQPSDWDGESFKENLRGKEGLEREYLVWDHALYAVQRAVRTRDYLMIRTYDDFGYKFEPVELYNITEDPYQTNNLAEEKRETVNRLSNLMLEWTQKQLTKDPVFQDPLIKVLEDRSKKLS